jgi:putative cell wall-binding protein
MRARPPIRTAIALAATALIVVTGANAVTEVPIVSRGGGSDHFSTVRATTPTPTDRTVAFIASVDDYADALAAAPATTLEHNRVLLVSRTAIPPSTAVELTRIRPATIAVLGGTDAVDDAVVSALRRYTTGSVTRIVGRDHDATAAAISATAFGPGVSAVYVASDHSLVDALLAGAAASRTGVPLLLIDRDGIAPPIARELIRLRPASIIIVGGIFAVSEKIAHLLGAYTTGPVTRETGADEYATAVAVSRVSFSTTASTVYLVMRSTLTPALLTRAVAAGLAGGPLLLVPGTCIPLKVSAEIARLNPTSVTILGETGGISSAMASISPC